ncbi:MAG: homoserine kinase [Gemmatimonadaceae bacterium]
MTPPARVRVQSPEREAATLAARRSTVRVPASTSNLGAGFDCVGVAVDLWLTATAAVTVREVGQHPEPNIDSTFAPTIHRSGTLAQLGCSATDDLMLRAFVAACAYRGRDVPAGLVIHAHSSIPVARGLGSSAAAIVAGVVLASEFMALGLTQRDTIDIAARIDGHPDNVAPSVIGGAALCVRISNDSYEIAPLPIHPSIRFVFAIPDFEFRTSVARAALPETLPFATAVEAAARAAALVTGLASGNEQLLRAGLADVLHVPFRRDHVNGYARVTHAAREAGAIGATLSGSGSAIVAVVLEGDTDRVPTAMAQAWRSLGVHAATLVSDASVGGMQSDGGNEPEPPG